MYQSQTASSNKTQFNNNSQEVEVTIRNLPNQAKIDDILEYLSIAGPIKSHKFQKCQQRYSATIIYHDNESAQLCKKFLGDRYYKGRALTITTQTKKGFNSINIPATVPTSFEQDIAIQISKLKLEERKILLGLLKGIKNEGFVFEAFIDSKPKIVQALIGKYFPE